jgi:hypothetical protein
MKATLLYLAAPLLVALLAPFAVEQRPFIYPPIVLIGVIPVVAFFTLAIAVPMYLAIPKAHRSRLAMMLGTAFFAGALSFCIFSFVTRSTFSQVGEVVYVKDGMFTLAGWLQLLSQSAWMGALSLPGGFLCWLGGKFKSRASRTATA